MGVPEIGRSIRGLAALMLSLLERAGGAAVTTIIRTKRGLQVAGLVVLVASVALVQSVAAQTDSVIVEVGGCVDLPTPEQRLACFEAQVDAARTAPAASPAAAPAAAPAASTAAVPAATGSTVPADFGFSEQEVERARERASEREREAPPEIIAKVAELRETVPNAYLITLDNGQVWRQTQPRYDFSLRPGFDVRVYESRWNSFRLTSSRQRGHIQVERVR
jgi:hypothetical protein